MLPILRHKTNPKIRLQFFQPSVHKAGKGGERLIR